MFVRANLSRNGGREGVVEILPCPFCGQPGQVDSMRLDSLSFKRDWWVECGNDECRVRPETDLVDSEQKAIETWNKRA